MENIATETEPSAPHLRAEDAIALGRKRRRFTRRAVGAIILFLIVMMIILRLLKPSVAPLAQSEHVFTVRSTVAEVMTHQPRLSVFGEVAAGKEADLRALVQGEVVEAAESFRNGGVVRKGDLLFSIDRFEYEAQVAELKAQIAETRARVVEAEARVSSETLSLVQDQEMLTIRDKEAARAENLSKRGNISDAARDQSKIALSQQTQTVARRDAAIKSEAAKLLQQRAALDRLRVSLQRAERDLTRTELRAPFDGFLSQVAAQQGSLLNNNDKVAKLVGANTLEVRAHLSDAQYGRLLQDGGLEGRPAQVVWKVGDETIRYDAVIARLTAQIQADTGGVTFYALVDADGLDLPIRPGAFVEVVLPDRAFANSVRLPNEALHDERRVFVIEGDRLGERDVTVLGRDGDDVILRGGLQSGDRVVLTRFNELAPGVKVVDPELQAQQVAALTESVTTEPDSAEDAQPGLIRRLLRRVFGGDDSADTPAESEDTSAEREAAEGS